MNSGKTWRARLAERYWIWRLYHLVVADAVSIQRPTKYRIVYEYLSGDLGRVIDIGCGPGVFTRYLCERASEVWAADVDETSLGRVKGRHHDRRNLHCIVTFADHLPFADNSLDTVLLLEVLEHVADDAACIREVCRVLAPGGRLVLSVPVPPGEVNEGDPWGHKREGYQLDQLQAMVRNNGFEVRNYRFAQFKFSRLGERLVQRWRRWFRLPAPIFLTWVGYLDHLLSSEARKTGGCLPACVLIMARKGENALAHKNLRALEQREACQ